MATNPTNTPAGPADRPLLDKAAAKHIQLGIIMIVVAAVLAVEPIMLSIREGQATLIESIAGGLLSLAFLAAGVLCLLLAPRDNLPLAEQLRFMFLVLGGVAGFIIAAAGLLLPFARYRSVFAGGLPEWGKNQPVVWGCAAAVFIGLGLMFVSLLLARGVERSNALMRRLMYGYNAFFSSFLLLAVLLLVNAFCYSRLPLFAALNQTYDWTASGVYTLSPATVSQLAALKQPVKVTILLPSNSEVRSALSTMLQNCEEVTPMLTWQATSPEVMDPEERVALRTKYDVPADMHGLLVVYGTEPKVYSTFIKEADLYEDKTQGAFGEDSSSKKKFTFKGEAALTTALDYLAEGKSKPVVYFTQGDGEMTFTTGTGEGRDSMSLLIENLGRGNFDLRPLPLGPTTKEIPEDASIVVLARPRNALPEAALNALRTYLKGADGKHGKLIALLEPSAPSGVPTTDPRLDALLGEYDVRLGHDRILTIDLSEDVPPTTLILAPSEGGSKLAQAFASRGYTFQFDDAQTVSPLTTNPEFRAETLLETHPQLRVWSQTDLRADAAALAREVRKQAEQGKFTQFSPKPLTVAVTVSEAKGAPPIPGHDFLPPQGGTPVLAVFGGADWVSNDSLEGAGGAPDFGLFASTVQWMREKPSLGPQIKTKSGAEREEFSMDRVTPEGSWRIEFVPGALILLAIIAVGLGVALVRRR